MTGKTVSLPLLKLLLPDLGVVLPALPVDTFAQLGQFSSTFSTHFHYSITLTLTKFHFDILIFLES